MKHLDSDSEHFVLNQTGARKIEKIQRVQSLWEGYGEILRLELDSGLRVILKLIRPPNGFGRSHERKLESYRVESEWYLQLGSFCDLDCRVPACGGQSLAEEEMLILLEDLDASGYDKRFRHPDPRQIESCLSWLARFHARFLHRMPEGLWPIGTYWHLSTRPDELRRMPDSKLKRAAAAIDEHLNSCRFQTFVHGDAKPANFCFGKDRVAAVDFQYVGGGCGIRDVAYFLDAVIPPQACEDRIPDLLDFYFDCLRLALGEKFDQALEAEWRSLFPFAWTDFRRFLAGWAPQYLSQDSFSLKMEAEVLQALA